ncbi:homoserine kinase [Zavarzinia compransoris]|uniref:homoserine kinase n=1 Tax=Zavarzinia marina TaxID=2911065 RepID=UPI001F2FE1E4|nr:homoserine kinase [Zavarzinia marina]MCF4164713.1 homoserine kinase [Zavarzinia marina]
MAVYTEVDDVALAAFLAEYDLGDMLSLKGIAEGVENTNYLLETTRDRFILTLFEKRVAEADLPFFVGLMDHLAQAGLSCPTPIHGRDGRALRRLAGRPAVIVSFLSGMSPKRPNVRQCASVGGALAGLHAAGADFALVRENALSLAGWRRLAQDCAGSADMVRPGLGDTIARELDFLEANWPADLPRGVIHADLFTDNVFFVGDEVSGLIDFYFACVDFYAYDLAICLNAWCFEADGAFNATKAMALSRGYVGRRRLSAAERAALPLLCRGSALRFLLTRLYDWLNQVQGALVRPKDPIEYLNKLRFHQEASGPETYGLTND